MIAEILLDGQPKPSFLQFFVSPYLYIAIFASIHYIYKVWYRTKSILLDESPVLLFVEIAKKDPDLPEVPKSK